MTSIIELPEDVVSKVAAGEVAENPAGIIKELIENAIDAKATEIEIDLKEGGTSKMVVTDNGHGMDEDDLKMSVKRHTTSKIKNVQDLYRVTTFGFRGEALNSIAAVSILTLRSKSRDSIAGTCIRVEFNELTDVAPIGMPDGTIISVENLYENVPARKSFLKEPTYELKRIVDVVTKLAIPHPEIRFNLRNDNKSVLTLNTVSTMEKRLIDLFGEMELQHHIPVSKTFYNVSVTGTLGKPQVATYAKRMQYLFVNNRCINNPEISQLIKSVYGNLVEPKAQPAYILFLNLPADEIDINVHPKKEYVRFGQETTINQFLRETVKETLENHDLTYTKVEYDTDILGNVYFGRKANDYLVTKLKETTPLWNYKTNSNQNTENEIIQIRNLYLAYEEDSKLVLVDQHAAHEKILYEELLANLYANESAQQKLENVEMFYEVAPAKSEFMTQYLDEFKTAGVYLEQFGNNIYKVTRIHHLLKKNNIQQLLNGVLDDLIETGKTTNHMDDETLKTLSFIACRSAIRAGEFLTQEERRNIVNKLKNSTSLYTCPHGRPLKMAISFKELERMFKRH